MSDVRLQAAIHDGFSSIQLSPAHRRIASYLVAHLDECRFLSAADLAERLNISQPSVTRFAQGQGYDGWAEFREALRKMSAESELAPAAAATWIEEVLDTEISNLSHLRSTLAVGEVRETGRRLMASQPLLVAGVRATVGVGRQFRWFASKLHPDVRLISDAGDEAYDALIQARQAGGSHLLTFLLPRYPRSAFRLLDSATRLGFQVTLVAPSDLALDLREVARIDLPISNSFAFRSAASAGVVSSILLQSMAEAEPRATQRRLDGFDQFAREHRIYAQSSRLGPANIRGTHPKVD